MTKELQEKYRRIGGDGDPKVLDRKEPSWEAPGYRDPGDWGIRFYFADGSYFHLPWEQAEEELEKIARLCRPSGFDFIGGAVALTADGEWVPVSGRAAGRIAARGTRR